MDTSIHILEEEDTLITVEDEFKKAVECLSTITTPQSIDDDIASAVPIWSILGITEHEYIEKYHAKKVETEEE